MQLNIKAGSRFRKWLLRAGFALAVLLFIIIPLVFLLVRDRLLHHAIEKAALRFRKHHIELSIAHAGFHGLGSLNIEDMSLLPEKADTLLRVQSVEADLSLIDAFLGNVRFDELRMANGYLQCISIAGQSNYDGLFEKTDTGETKGEEDENKSK